MKVAVEELILSLVQLDLVINDIPKFQVILLPNNINNSALASFALPAHYNSLFDLLSLVGFKDLEPIEQSLTHFLPEILQARDAKAHILSVLV
jgi:hypothetical protein